MGSKNATESKAVPLRLVPSSPYITHFVYTMFGPCRFLENIDIVSSPSGAGPRVVHACGRDSWEEQLGCVHSVASSLPLGEAAGSQFPPANVSDSPASLTWDRGSV